MDVGSPVQTSLDAERRGTRRYLKAYPKNNQDVIIINCVYIFRLFMDIP